MAKLLNITIADLSYEKEPGRSENKGVNHDEQVSDIQIKRKAKDAINFDQQMPIIKSFETDEDFINEEKIIGISGIASISSQSKIPNNQESPSYICSVCDVIFSQKKDLKKHMDIHFNEDVFPCDKCGKVFKSMTSLKLHKLNHGKIPLLKLNKLSHGNLPLPKVKETGKSVTKEVSKENETGKSVTKEVSKVNETGKSETTEAPKEFHCPICPRTYTRKATLNQHMNLHTGLKPYKCLTCGKGFRNRIIRNIHSKDCFSVKDVKINDNIEKEMETEAEHIFIEGNPVVENINIKKEVPENMDDFNFDNTNEIDQNNFECKVCQKVLTSKNSLDKHIVLNGCDKRYKCPFCSTKFIHKGNIKRHVKIKHPGENIEDTNKSQLSINPKENETNESLLIHKCNYCPTAFLKENNLKIHIKQCKKRNTNIEDAKQKQDPVKSVEKTGDKATKLLDFKCPSCPEKFKEKEDLDWHIEIDHYLSDSE